MPSYLLYGLEVSSDLELAGLSPADRTAQTDVVCYLGQPPPGVNAAQLQKEKPLYTSRILDAHGVPLLRIWRFASTGHYCFLYCEGLMFFIDASGSRIWAAWPPSVTAELVTGYLVGQILSFVLHLRGCICLHASAVAIAGRAVLFAGDPGRGKSSTAAAFAERGWPVLADDVSALRPEPDGRLFVLPGPPRVCLWPDSAEFLYGSGAAGRLPEVFVNDGKRLVHLDAASGKHQQEPAPLAAVYLLAPRSGDPAAPRIEPLADAGLLIPLLTTGFVSGALDSAQRAREFQLQAEITRIALVRQLVPSSDPKKLSRLCELVEADVRMAILSPARCAS